MSKIA
jgi:hypothetical protein